MLPDCNTPPANSTQVVTAPRLRAGRAHWVHTRPCIHARPRRQVVRRLWQRIERQIAQIIEVDPTLRLDKVGSGGGG